jgi:galactose-1-phosphate uridylyltransferase (family 1)
MISEIFQESPHRRWNPLKQEWVIVSPHGTERPWQGQTEDTTQPPSLAYDPSCYLCPGNTRAGGHKTPQYTAPYVFENDFAALKPDAPSASLATSATCVLAQTRSSPASGIRRQSFGFRASMYALRLWCSTPGS